MTVGAAQAASGPIDACVLGVDIGAGSLKTTVVDARGRERGSASHPVATYTPHAGWSEQDPEAWWDATVAAVVPATLRVEPSCAPAVVSITATLVTVFDVA